MSRHDRSGSRGIDGSSEDARVADKEAALQLQERERESETARERGGDEWEHHDHQRKVNRRFCAPKSQTAVSWLLNTKAVCTVFVDLTSSKESPILGAPGLLIVLGAQPHGVTQGTWVRCCQLLPK